MDGATEEDAADHDSGVIIFVASLEKATEASDMVLSIFFCVDDGRAAMRCGCEFSLQSGR